MIAVMIILLTCAVNQLMTELRFLRHVERKLEDRNKK
jgi:hypothetical protein